jgi:[ribosomal protein S5]-alanine N-acetyltransferase
MLETERLILRPMMIEDAIHLLELNSDPMVIRYTGDSSCKTIVDAQKIVTELSIPQFQKFKMGRFSVLKKDGTYLGWCGLKKFPEQNEVDLGYRFHQHFWGQGFATESSRESLDYGFNVLKLNKIVARAMPENIPSIKVMQKLGMTFRGIVNDPCEPHGFILYDLTSAEYNKCKK